jgi:hypothetical protein
VSLTEALLTKFVSRFGVQRGLHRDQGRNFKSHLLQGVSKTQHLTPALAGWHDGSLYESDPGAPVKSHRVTPESSERKVIRLPPYLHGTQSQSHITTVDQSVDIMYIVYIHTLYTRSLSVQARYSRSCPIIFFVECLLPSNRSM